MNSGSGAGPGTTGIASAIPLVMRVAGMTLGSGMAPTLPDEPDEREYLLREYSRARYPGWKDIHFEQMTMSEAYAAWADLARYYRSLRESENSCEGVPLPMSRDDSAGYVSAAFEYARMRLSGNPDADSYGWVRPQIFKAGECLLIKIRTGRVVLFLDGIAIPAAGGQFFFNYLF